MFCAEFQSYPLKFLTKYLTHSLTDVLFAKKCKCMVTGTHMGSWIKNKIKMMIFTTLQVTAPRYLVYKQAYHILF